jgi:hypothetical protein
MFSCSPEPDIKPQNTDNEPKFKTETYYKVVASIKTKQETNTDYHYEYDWWNGGFKQQPFVSSQEKYYAIYTDGSYDEITMAQSIILTGGDSVIKTRQIPVNK